MLITRGMSGMWGKQHRTLHFHGVASCHLPSWAEENKEVYSNQWQPQSVYSLPYIHSLRHLTALPTGVIWLVSFCREICINNMISHWPPKGNYLNFTVAPLYLTCQWFGISKVGWDIWHTCTHISYQALQNITEPNSISVTHTWKTIKAEAQVRHSTVNSPSTSTPCLDPFIL